MLRAGPVADLAKSHRRDTARHRAGIDARKHAQFEPAVAESGIREQHDGPAEKPAVADAHPLATHRAAVPSGGQPRRLGLECCEGGEQVGQRPDFFLQRNAHAADRVAVQPGAGHLDEAALRWAGIRLHLGQGQINSPRLAKQNRLPGPPGRERDA